MTGVAPHLYASEGRRGRMSTSWCLICSEGANNASRWGSIDERYDGKHAVRRVCAGGRKGRGRKRNKPAKSGCEPPTTAVSLQARSAAISAQLLWRARLLSPLFHRASLPPACPSAAGATLAYVAEILRAASRPLRSFTGEQPVQCART